MKGFVSTVKENAQERNVRILDRMEISPIGVPLTALNLLKVYHSLKVPVLLGLGAGI